MFEVFTTLRLINGQALWLEEHLDRLHRHAKLAGLKIPPSPCPLPSTGEGKFLMRLSLSMIGYHVQTRPLPMRPNTPVRVFISDQIATSQIKTNNRAVYDEAFKQAQKHGAFEGLLLNSEAYVVDGSRSSLILRQNKMLISLQGGIEGITRQKVLKEAKHHGFEIKEAYLKSHELEGELYLAGSGIGLLSTTMGAPWVNHPPPNPEATLLKIGSALGLSPDPELNA